MAKSRFNQEVEHYRLPRAKEAGSLLGVSSKVIQYAVDRARIAIGESIYTSEWSDEEIHKANLVSTLIEKRSADLRAASKDFYQNRKGDWRGHIDKIRFIDDIRTVVEHDKTIRDAIAFQNNRRSVREGDNL